MPDNTRPAHHKWHKCKASLEQLTDIRIATEIARLESFAMESYGTFALDQVTSVQPRRQRLKAVAEASPSTSGQLKRGGRSNYTVSFEMQDMSRK